MNTPKHAPRQPCTCCVLLRTGEPLESNHGDRPCTDISRIELCPMHAAAPAMYEALCGLLEYYGAYNPVTDKRIEPYIRKAKAALAQAEAKS